MTKYVVIHLSNGKMVEIDPESGDSKLIESIKGKAKALVLSRTDARSRSGRVLSVRVKPQFRIAGESIGEPCRPVGRSHDNSLYSVAGKIAAHAESLNTANFVKSLKRDPSDKELTFYRKFSQSR